MNVSLLASPQFYSKTLYVIGFLSLPIHILGGYCILFQTPESMKSVKSNLLNMYFWTTLLDVYLNLLTQPFLCPPPIDGFAMGLLSRVGINLPLHIYSGITIVALVAVSVVSIFENRFYLLWAKGTWWRYVRYLILIGDYIIAVLFFVPSILGIPEQETARKELFEMYPHIQVFDSPEHRIFIVDLRQDNSYMIRTACTITYIVGQGAIFVILLQYNIIRAIKRMTISKSTANLQRAFLRALYLQV
ncbi:hypothetical protein CRE_05082 [Caenorhabditis remanei]|uniref:Serpentine Receptor, class H n=1 Tax=Caenorhabditis remanei TaxID=31234 RepID=E3MZ39_CAERE|nr:hypothetical protein CRE_05082 [Caenorhabditis remanei]